MSTKSLLALAVIALALLMFFCIKTHLPMLASPIAAPSAVATPASLSATIRDGRVAVGGVMPDVTTRDATLAAARKLFGDSKVTDATTIGSNVAAPRWLATLPALMASGKTLGNGELRIEDASITVTGEVASAADKTARIAEVTAAAGIGAKVMDRLTVAAPSAPSAPLQTQLNNAMLNRIIEFETGSAVLTAKGTAILDGVAPIIKQSPPAQIEIAGHTDSRGAADANQQLSRARANAVREYLVARGVEAARLKASGYGAARPVADNTTRDGQQKNRRIEFSVTK